MRLEIAHDLAAIRPATDLLESGLESAPPEAHKVLRLVVEELVTNVIKYGCVENEGSVIVLEAEFLDDTLRITVTDDARDFDPRTVPPPPLDGANRAVGGLGLHLIRTTADSVDYERVDGRNVVTVRKRFGG